MVKEERFTYILAVLNKKGKVGFDTLSKDLEVSEDTIRRDIEALHNNGLLLKVRGGAIAHAKNPINFQDRTTHFSAEKQIIGLKAQTLMKGATTIFMDGGTTNCAILQNLPANAKFRLITNNLALLPIISRLKDIELIILGGTYDRKTETNTGMQVIAEVGKYLADIYFMGTCALQKDFGITTALQQDGEIKQQMLKHTTKTYAIGNSAKLNLTEFYRVCELQDLEGLITDLPADNEALDPYRNNGLLIV